MVFTTVHMKISTFIASFLMIFTSSAMDTTISQYNDERDQEAIMGIVRSEPTNLLDQGQPDPIKHAIMYIHADGKTLKNFLGWEHSFNTKVINYNNKPVGFIQYMLLRKKTLGCLDFGTQGYIHLLGVAKEHREHGFGKELLEKAIADLRGNGATSITLYAQSDNSAACKLYERMGFNRKSETWSFLEENTGTTIKYMKSIK